MVTALELDGNDVRPLIKYTKEILYDEAEKQGSCQNPIAGHRRLQLCTVVSGILQL
jgi:hypothetical protein